jgi:hypothetical protein
MLGGNQVKRIPPLIKSAFGRRLWLVVCLVVMASAVLWFGLVGVWWLGDLVNESKMRARHELLLRGTDQISMLTTCRWMMTQMDHYETGSNAQSAWLRGADGRLPENIRALHCTSVSVERDAVRIEMGGGFCHYGLEAYDADTAVPYGYGADDVDYAKLIDGLWFYTENRRLFRELSPNPH